MITLVSKRSYHKVLDPRAIPDEEDLRFMEAEGMPWSPDESDYIVLPYLLPAVKREWVHELRHGRWIQGRGALCRVRSGKEDNGRKQSYAFCCLGVLAEVSGLPWRESRKRDFLDGEDTWWLESEYGDEASIAEGILDSDLTGILVELNDEFDWTFKQIADWVEKNL